MTTSWAVVTGASGGIGAAFAQQFAAAGVNVVLVARNKKQLDTVARSLQEQGIKTEVFVADLSDPGQPQKLHQFVQSKKITPLYLVNNAGFGDYGLLTKADPQKLQNMLQLNVAALTSLAHYFGKEMQKRNNGYIVNVASTAAFFPGPYMAAYYASKSYVLSLSVALNEELRSSGVSVTALCPGPTESNFAVAAAAERTNIFAGKLPSSESVAAFGYRAMLARRPVAVHGWRNRLVTALAGLLPRPQAAKIVRRIQT